MTMNLNLWEIYFVIQNYYEKNGAPLPIGLRDLDAGILFALASPIVNPYGPSLRSQLIQSLILLRTE